MEAGHAANPGLSWLVYALMTVAAWGLYGIFLHTGQVQMGDPINGRYKAFLFVGIAYFLTAVVAPIAVLLFNRADWSISPGGAVWSLVAGTVGAIGAFGVLLAFGAKGTPPVVMSIIFAGAPVVNAVVSLLWHPPAAGLGSLRWQFLLGILMAALGGCLVTLYKPGPAAPAKAPPPAVAEAGSPVAGAPPPRR